MSSKRLRQIMTTCVHFTGIQNETCKAGINYRTLVGGPDLGWARKIPCCGAFHDEPKAKCESQKLPNEAEATLELQEENILIDRHKRTIHAAHAHAKEQGYGIGKGGVGALPCPICGGLLRYSVASVNGHMHAACTTDGCVRWME